MNLGSVGLLGALAVAAPAFAQEDYRVEAFGGFAHQRGDPGPTFPDQSRERNGWVASQTAYVRPWIGVEVEVSETFGSYDQLPFHDGTREFAFRSLKDDRRTFLFGPRFRVLSRERFTLGGHVLAGLAQSSREFGFSFGGEAPFGGVSTNSSNRFGGAIGASLDMHLTDRFSWRIQPDWMIRPRQGLDSSFRLSTGVVFRFGGRRN